MTDQGNNNQNISCNPFAALFSSVADAQQFASAQKTQQPSAKPCEYSQNRLLQPFNNMFCPYMKILYANLEMVFFTCMF